MSRQLTECLFRPSACPEVVQWETLLPLEPEHVALDHAGGEWVLGRECLVPGSTGSWKLERHRQARLGTLFFYIVLFSRWLCVCLCRYR